MFNKAAIITKHTRQWMTATRNLKRETSLNSTMRNDRNIIEGLQVPYLKFLNFRVRTAPGKVMEIDNYFPNLENN